MKREILFRAQLLYSKELVEGDLIKLTDGILIRQQGKPNLTFPIISKVIPDTVCQFTGLTDKNGTKIFEGDIIFNDKKTILTCKEDPRLYLVKWENGEYGCNKNSDTVWLKQKPSFIFEKINPIGKNYMSLIFNRSNIEVVGNIYDNPELLK